MPRPWRNPRAYCVQRGFHAGSDGPGCVHDGRHKRRRRRRRVARRPRWSSMPAATRRRSPSYTTSWRRACTRFALRWTRSRSAAEDTVQQTLLQIHAARHRFVRGSAGSPGPTPSPADCSSISAAAACASCALMTFAIPRNRQRPHQQRRRSIGGAWNPRRGVTSPCCRPAGARPSSW